MAMMQTVLGMLLGGGRNAVTETMEVFRENSEASAKREQAFKTASLMAFREAYKKAKPIILEPIMKLEVSAPEEFQGTVIGQINQRRGVIVGTETDAGYVTVESEVPLSEMFGYSTDLRSVTQGKGEFSMEFAKYLQVPKSIQDEMVKDYQEKKAEENK